MVHMSNANVYQLNHHDGQGWRVINEANLRERLGSSWEYAEWCFDQGKSASVRSVEYRRVAARPPQIRIEVERRVHVYFFSRHRGETLDVAAQPISRDRAMQLVENNPGGEGEAVFDVASCNWTYTAVFRLEEMES
jgi:hypothetical protein